MSFSPVMNTRHTADATCRYGGHAINEGLFDVYLRRPSRCRPRWLEPGVYDRQRCHSCDRATQPVSSWLRIRSNLIM